MLIYKNGDLLKSKENIICHQVNVNGVMGGGLAYQIASLYPKVEEGYYNFCKDYHNDYEKLKGMALLVSINDNQSICNCFTQKLNFDTDYIELEKCFRNIFEDCKKKNKTIAVPYKYGCGIANGDWNIVKSIFEKLSKEYEVDISIYSLESEVE